MALSRSLIIAAVAAACLPLAPALAQETAACGAEPRMQDYTIYKGEGKTGYASDTKRYHACVNGARAEARARKEADENGLRVARSLADKGVRATTAEEMKRRFEQAAGLVPGSSQMSSEAQALFQVTQTTSDGTFKAGAAGRGIPATIARTSTNSAIDAGKGLAAAFETALGQAQAAGVATPPIGAAGTLVGSPDPATGLASRFEASRTSIGQRAEADRMRREREQADYLHRSDQLDARMAVAHEQWMAEDQRRRSALQAMRLQEIQAKANSAARSSSGSTRPTSGNGKDPWASEIGKAGP